MVEKWAVGGAAPDKERARRNERRFPQEPGQDICASACPGVVKEISSVIGGGDEGAMNWK